MAAHTRTGIVTGGSGGIGRVPAERLARDVRVVIAHSGNRRRAEEVVVAIGAAGGDEISLPSQVRNVSGVPIPNMPATAVIAAHCDEYCGRTSATMRTARSRSSSGYLLGRPITQILPRSGVPGLAGTGQSALQSPDQKLSAMPMAAFCSGVPRS